MFCHIKSERLEKSPSMGLALAGKQVTTRVIKKSKTDTRIWADAWPTNKISLPKKLNQSLRTVQFSTYSSSSTSSIKFRRTVLL